MANGKRAQGRWAEDPRGAGCGPAKQVRYHRGRGLVLAFRGQHASPDAARDARGAIDLEDEQVERKFDDGRILIGYVAKEIRKVAIHNWPIDPDGGGEVVKRRIRGIFPHAEYFVGAEGERHLL